ncbi:efflux transporter outer membrane subunit [Sphingoaurantiacus capsulatus]|uniref:Efflux transporter outer membrane subunit n=1 Tax=Sphingoaurantiacus capsulatus TaxID=1771310 RepID=A0ABV7XA95_9SPHN
MSFRTFAIRCLPLALLAGCTVGPDYKALSPAELGVPARFNAAAADVVTADQVDLARWWRGFNDPTLTTLVERGLAANLDISQAGSRLRQARASLRGTRGALFPTLSVGGSASRTIGRSDGAFVDDNGNVTTTEGDQTRFQLGFDAAYEADLFGGTRRSIEAARADLAGSEASLRSTQLTIASEIALSYLDARFAQVQLRVARDSLASLDETVQIVDWRVQAGLVGSLDLEQARQLRAQTAGNIPQLEASYTAAVNRLAVLLGETPGAVTPLIDAAAARDIPLAPAASDIPADVLRRRPDISIAERSLAAETARIGVQTAQLYPALRLSGSFGGSGLSIGDSIDTSIGNLIASITAPIFQGGQIRAAIEGQRAATDAALAAYRQAVLVALEETENALTQVAASERREREVLVADEASRNAVLLARSQYRAGLSDFQSLLESERSLLSSQESRVAARADRAIATVQLYKALGGGWQAAPLPASVTTSAARP